MEIRQTNQGFNFDKYPIFEQDIDPKQRAWIEVEGKALEANVRQLKTKLSTSCKFMAVVKADGDKTISPLEWARKSNTIPWEILCSFKNRLPRVQVD